MICRGCSDTHAITNIELGTRIIKRPQNNDSITKSYSLGFNKNSEHVYIYFTETRLRINGEYVTDFYFKHDPNRKIPFFNVKLVTAKLTDLKDFSFGNKELALKGGLYPLVLRQTSVTWNFYMKIYFVISFLLILLIN